MKGSIFWHRAHRIRAQPRPRLPAGDRRAPPPFALGLKVDFRKLSSFLEKKIEVNHEVTEIAKIYFR